MSSLIVEIVKIKEIVNHPNPKVERLELVRFENKDGILGWQVVVRKGEYKVGDLAIYTPIDSLLPEKLETYLFPLDSKIKLNKSRVRSIKIQQALSQGMIIPFNDEGIQKLYPTLSKKKFGENVTNLLEITKFEPPEQHISKGMKGRIAKKNHPLFTKYLDLEHYKKYPNVFQPEDEIYLSEKVHGSSTRMAYLPTYINKWDLWKKIIKFFGLLPKYQFIVGSRNVQFTDRKENKNKIFYDKNIYQLIADKLNIKNKLKPNEQLFGEIVGYNVQSHYTYGCKQDEKEYDFYAYDVKIDGKWLNTEDFFTWCKEREIQKVPFIYKGKLKDIDLYKTSQGPSLILDSNGKTTQPEREGIVIRSYREEFAPQIGRKILKFVSDKFLLDDTNTDLH